MFNNKHFSNFLGICSVLPALAIMPAMAEDVAKIDDTGYATLGAAIDAVTSGQTIIMQQDVPEGAGKSVASGKNFTIDFGTHGYTAYTTSVGSSGTTTQIFQLLKDSTVVLKNGKIDVASETAPGEDGNFLMGIQNYSNLTLDNMVVDGTNLLYASRKPGGSVGVPRYTLSNNYGTTNIKNSTIIAKEGGVAFDVCDNTSASYAGPTRVIVNNSNIYGDVEVSSGEAFLTLSGNNKFVGNIINDGKIDIADDLNLEGVITGNGTIDFTSNTNLVAWLQGTPTISAADVTGVDNVTIAGLIAENGLSTKEYTLIDNADEKFGGIADDATENALYTFAVGEGNGSILVTRKSVAEQTANLEKAGLDSAAAKTVAAISGVKTMGNEQVDALFTELTVAAQAGDADAIAQINEVAKAINPESESVVQSVAVSTQNTINNLTAGRMALGHNGGDVDLTAGGVWVQGLYNKSKNADKFSANTRGISAGIDGTINNDIMVGIGYAFGRSDVNAQTRDTDIDSHSVFLYGQYKPSEWYANATLNYTTSKYEENGISIVPVDSEYRANTFGANVATGYDFASGITPELGLRYMHVRTNAYTNSLGMDVDANSTDFLTGMIGARYGFDIMAGDAFLIRPELSAAAKYDMLSDENTATIALPGVNAYTLDGERLNRFGGEFGAGLTMSYYGFDLSLTYSIDVRKDYTSQTGMAKFRYNF